MKKLILVLAFGLVLGMATSAFADPSIIAILDYLYGAGNYAPVAPGMDQIWYNSGSVTSYAEAKYADYSQEFGYIDGTGFHALMPVVTGNGYLLGSPSATLPFTPGNIRLADRVNGGTFTWSSLVSENSDIYDHMWTYQITTGSFAGDYVVGFEDTYGGGDNDHNDFVVQFHGASPVPEPSSMALLGMGVLGLFGLGRKRKV